MTPHSVRKSYPHPITKTKLTLILLLIPTLTLLSLLTLLTLLPYVLIQVEKFGTVLPPQNGEVVDLYAGHSRSAYVPPIFRNTDDVSCAGD